MIEVHLWNPEGEGLQDRVRRTGDELLVRDLLRMLDEYTKGLLYVPSYRNSRRRY